MLLLALRRFTHFADAANYVTIGHPPIEAQPLRFRQAYGRPRIHYNPPPDDPLQNIRDVIRALNTVHYDSPTGFV